MQKRKLWSWRGQKKEWNLKYESDREIAIFFVHVCCVIYSVMSKLLQTFHYLTNYPSKGYLIYFQCCQNVYECIIFWYTSILKLQIDALSVITMYDLKF